MLRRRPNTQFLRALVRFKSLMSLPGTLAVVSPAAKPPRGFGSRLTDPATPSWPGHTGSETMCLRSVLSPPDRVANYLGPFAAVGPAGPGRLGAETT